MMLPHVVIVGAGPAGLLLSILLSQVGIRTTVLEKSSVTDTWSTRSYSININQRGQSALAAANVLEQAKAVAMTRTQIVFEPFDGQRKTIPKNPPDFAFARPDLVECLEGCLEEQTELATVQRGAGVTNVEEKENEIEVTLDNGKKLSCTHVVAADGKWSAVRNCLAEYKDAFVVQSVPAFAVFLKADRCPARWEREATSIFRPVSPKYYAIAAPLKDGTVSVTIVCYTEIKEDHPWLVPREEDAHVDWESEYANCETTSDLESKLTTLLEKEMPQFYKEIRGSVRNTRINRRGSWLKPLTDDPSYCSRSGRVALIGDAAHAMTASIGEGCNCALESAASLVHSLRSRDTPVTADDLTQAFRDYGAKRPREVMPIQQRSAAANHFKKPEAGTGICS